MLDFQNISIEDRERVENYFEFLEEPFCDFTFGNLFCWSVVENTKIAFLLTFCNLSAFAEIVFDVCFFDVPKEQAGKSFLEKGV